MPKRRIGAAAETSRRGRNEEGPRRAGTGFEKVAALSLGRRVAAKPRFWRWTGEAEDSAEKWTSGQGAPSARVGAPGERKAPPQPQRQCGADGSTD